MVSAGVTTAAISMSSKPVIEICARHGEPALVAFRQRADREHVVAADHGGGPTSPLRAPRAARRALPKAYRASRPAAAAQARAPRSASASRTPRSRSRARSLPAVMPEIIANSRWPSSSRWRAMRTPAARLSKPTHGWRPLGIERPGEHVRNLVRLDHLQQRSDGASCRAAPARPRRARSACASRALRPRRRTRGWRRAACSPPRPASVCSAWTVLAKIALSSVGMTAPMVRVRREASARAAPCAT